MPIHHMNMLIGQELFTLGHQKPFTVVDLTPNHVFVMPHATQVNRAIPIAQIIAAYQSFVEAGHINLNGIRTHCEMSPVYIAAIFATMPHVLVNRLGPAVVLEMQ